MSMLLEVKLESTGNWGTGGNGLITVKNIGPIPIFNWVIPMKTSNFTITQFWTFVLGSRDTEITVTPPSWSTTLNAGQSIQSGFAYNGSGNFMVTSSDKNIKFVLPNAGGTTPTTPPLTSAKKVFGYFSEWNIYQRMYNVENIPVNQLTHILYAFMLPNPNQTDYNILASNMAFPPKPYTAPPTVPEGTLVSQDAYANGINIAKLKTLKAQNPNIKILISVGGWTMSWNLSKIVANPTLKATFVKSSVDFVVNNGFDGLDMDWEYPGVQGAGYNYVDAVNDTPNLINLFKDLRTEFNARTPTKHYELTAAMGCNPDVIKNYIGVAPHLDYVTLMTYDFAGSWGDGGHLAGLYYNPKSGMDPEWNADAAVKNAINIGFTVDKICLGCPLYARGWAKIVPNDAATPLFGKSVSGPATSYSGAAGEPGMTSWKDLRDKVNVNGLNRYYDNVAHACYVHNSTTGETWSYDDPEIITEKASYVKDKKLAGMMFWELSDDTRDGVKNLLTAAVTTLNTDTTIPPPTQPPTQPPSQPPTQPPTTPTTSGLTIQITNKSTSDYTIKSGQTVLFNV